MVNSFVVSCGTHLQQMCIDAFYLWSWNWWQDKGHHSKKTPGTNIAGVNTDCISLFVLPFPQNMIEILNISPTSYMSFCRLSLSQAG